MVLKALEILKSNEFRFGLFENKLQEIDEAIKELEALIEKDKKKNCEECFNLTNLALKIKDQSEKDR